MLATYSITTPPAGVHLTDLAPPLGDFRGEVLAGLGRQQKSLPCKYIYDERGSALFERICELDEYYPTRTELRIMTHNTAAISRTIGTDCLLVEYGSGSSIKTRVLLDHLQNPAGYVPIDISKTHLLRSAESLSRAFPVVPVWPVCADYTTPFNLPVDRAHRQNVVAYFPGSTIGNFLPDEAADFLLGIRRLCGPGSGLLIGVDLKKDPVRLHAAYNDAAGVTAQFNLNLLHRINREIGGNFDPEKFAHYAPFIPTTGRMEMHLVSRAHQHVTVAGQSFEFQTGESIHTESCCKYTPAAFETLAASVGYVRRQIWVDEESLFSVQFFTADPAYVG